jgi:hypothetical protein
MKLRSGGSTFLLIVEISPHYWQGIIFRPAITELKKCETSLVQ